MLPTLFGPALAAYVAHVAGWRWVFLGVVVMVAAAAALVAPALRTPRRAGRRGARTALATALGVTAAVAVLGLELLGSRRGALALLMVAAAAIALVAVARLVPAGTLALRRGLPAVIGTRGLLSGAFFCGETYIIFVLQERWGLSAGVAGLALTGVGLSWTAASWVQSRLSTHPVRPQPRCVIGSVLVLSGSLGLTTAVVLHVPAPLAVATYVLAGTGMGLAYPRTSVAMLADSGDSDRGFNSSALSIADSLGGALTISASGVVFAVARGPAATSSSLRSRLAPPWPRWPCWPPPGPRAGGQRTTSYVVCTAHSEGCTERIRRSTSFSNPVEEPLARAEDHRRGRR